MATRGDFTVIALVLLTWGNALATFWAGGLAAGVVLTAMAAACLALALRATLGAPSRQVIAGGVGCCVLSLVDHPLPPVLTIAVLVLAVTGVVSTRFRIGIALVVVAAVIVVVAEAVTLHWGQMAFDVFHEMQVATGALSHGMDPYGPTVPVLIPINDHNAYMAPEHFGYGPAILLLGLPGRLIGDVRLSQAAIWIAAAVVIGFLARRRAVAIGVGAVALVLLSPFGVDLAEHAFNDAGGALCLLLWFLGRQRHPRWASLALGVALATKPTILAALLVMLFWSRTARRDIWWGLGVAAAIVIPFALWDGIGNFLRSTIELWFGPTFFVNRADAISVGALIHSFGLPYLSSALIAGLTLLVAVLLLRRRPRDSVDLLIAGSVLTIAYLLLERLAFLNYYSVAAMLLMAAIALDGGGFFSGENDIGLPFTRARVGPETVATPGEPVAAGRVLQA